MLLALLVLVGCQRAENPEIRPPLALTLASPTYGAFVGDDGVVVVEGSVVPADAQLIVNDVAVRPDENGAFRAELPFPADSRALVVDVYALDGDQRIHELVPVFDGENPRLTDPGAISGRLTPSGLDALEPLVEEQIAALGIEDQLFAALPAFESDYFSLVPRSVTSDGPTVDLTPGLADIGVAIGLEQLTIEADVVILGFTIPMSAVSSVSIGARAQPSVDAEGMLGVTLTSAIVEISDPNIGFFGTELPEWLADAVLDPVAGWISSLGESLGGLLVDQLGDVVIGGPFAFETSLGGADLAARLVDVSADLDGLALGVTVSTEGDAADALPDDLTALGPATPSGVPYQLGLALHEGLVNAVLDAAIGDFLDIDVPLSGSIADVFGVGIEGLPGGDELPDDIDGYCLSLKAGDARVARMAAAAGAPLAQVWLPDVRFAIETLSGGDCDPWLEASVFATVDLTLDGTTVSADLDVREVRVLDYAAVDASRQETADEVGALVESLAGLLAGQLSFDLSDLAGGLGGGLGTEPRLVAVEPLVGPDGALDGRWGVYLDVF